MLSGENRRGLRIAVAVVLVTAAVLVVGRLVNGDGGYSSDECHQLLGRIVAQEKADRICGREGG